jgi:hypothetical protein
MKGFRNYAYCVLVVFLALSSNQCGVGVITTIAWTGEYPVRAVATMPPGTNSDELFKTAQSVIALSKYSITQSNPQTGLISGRNEHISGIETLNIQISKEPDGKVFLLMAKNYADKAESVLGPMPPKVAKDEIIRTAKLIAKTNKINENDIIMKFKDDEKPLSSY